MYTRRLSAMCLCIVMTVGAAVAAGAADEAATVPNTAAAPASEATLSFARSNVWNWEADGDKGIWVQGIGREWYYGKFMSPCIDLPFRDGVGFRYGPSGELDKFSAVVIRHQPPCNFISFTRSAGPPHAQKGKAQAGAGPAPAPAAAPSGSSD